MLGLEHSDYYSWESKGVILPDWASSSILKGTEASKRRFCKHARAHWHDMKCAASTPHLDELRFAPGVGSSSKGPNAERPAGG